MAIILMLGHSQLIFAQAVATAATATGATATQAAANAATGNSLSAQCSTNKLACIMAGLSFAQVASSLFSSKSSRSAAQSLTGPANYATTDFGNGLTGEIIDQKIAFAEGQLNSGLATLKKNAPFIDMNKGTVKTADGKSVPLSSLNSGKALVDAGFADPSQIAALDEKLKQMNDFKMPALNGSPGGGGGGSSGSSKYAAPSMPDFNFGGEGEKPAAPVGAGLVKLANGEPIGTASDNLFDMIHDRYQKKVKEKMFVGQEAAAN
jgi:hypothetical protein